MIKTLKLIIGIKVRYYKINDLGITSMKAPYF
jgi:hypothetical protein